MRKISTYSTTFETRESKTEENPQTKEEPQRKKKFNLPKGRRLVLEKITARGFEAILKNSSDVSF